VKYHVLNGAEVIVVAISDSMHEYFVAKVHVQWTLECAEITLALFTIHIGLAVLWHAKKT
jgi:hypothetical protein